MTKYKIDKPLIFLIISSFILFSVIFVHNSNKKYQYPPMASEVCFDVYLPVYVPEGFDCDVMEIDDAFAYLEFHKEDGKKLSFTQMPAKSFTLDIDNENHKITEFKNEKYNGYHMHPLKSDVQTLVFWNENNLFQIMGQITEKEIIKMANSLSLIYSP